MSSCLRRACFPSFPFRENLAAFVKVPCIFLSHSLAPEPILNNWLCGVSMHSQHLTIRICRHILPDGRHCHGAAVRGRACCRHHLDARTRLHNMARARRLVCVPRLRVPETFRDLALNRAEVLRVVNSGAVDFATARMMFWALDLTATTLPADLASVSRRDANSNVCYQVPLSPLFARSYIRNPSQMVENTWEAGEGVPPPSRLGNPTPGRVGFLQPRRGAISKPSASALGIRKGNRSPRRDEI